MTYRVQVEPPALDALARGMDTDRDGAVAVFEFIDALANDPRPTTSVAWGPEYRRARIGAWRVLYRIDDAIEIIAIEHIGRNNQDDRK